MRKNKVMLMGYGSQGTRIASAISAQPDFQLDGICMRTANVFAHMAHRKGYPIYVPREKDVDSFKKANMTVQGTLSDALPRVDVVVDATPSGVGKMNKNEWYSQHDLKCIFQAGETFDVADIPVFHTAINYESAKNANSIRIPSPFSIALMKTLIPLERTFGITHVESTLIRPGSEPMRGHAGPVDSIVIDHSINELVNTEIGKVLSKDVCISSVVIPSILLAVQVVLVELENLVSTEQVLRLFHETPRIIFLRGKMGLDSTDAIFEYVRRTTRPSADIYESCLWHESVRVTVIKRNKLKFIQAFDPHCIQIPEIIDAMRALVSSKNKSESIELTNKSLKILDSDIYP